MIALDLLGRWRSIAAALALLALAPLATATPTFPTPTTEWNAVPTFHSLGFYWDPPGKSASNTAQIELRVAGSTGAFRRGYDLWYDTRNAEYRGSLVKLEPGTSYEINLKLVDGSGNVLRTLPVSGCANADNQCTATWSETFNVPENFTVTLPAGTSHIVVQSANVTEPTHTFVNGTLTVNVPSAESPLPKYTLIKNSDTDKLVNGANASANWACVNIAPGVHHVIIKGLLLQECTRYGILLEGFGNTHHIVIEDNEFIRWGGFGFDPVQPHMPNDDGAIQCANNEKATVWPARIVVQRNNFHNPRWPGTYWNQQNVLQPDGSTVPNEDPQGHPRGAQALFWHTCGANHVIRYNDIYSTNGNNFNDAMGGCCNFSQQGFPWADSDIYGNRISHVYDDAIESEGAGRNVRIWANYIDLTFSPIGNVVVSIGPEYVWRNVTNNLAKMRNPNLAADDDMRPAWLKGGKKNIPAPGRSYFFHNTVLQPPKEECGGVLWACGAGNSLSQVDGDFYDFVSHNNVWQTHRTDSRDLSILGNCESRPCKADHDLNNNTVCFTPTLGCNNTGFSAFPSRETWRDKTTAAYAAGGGSYPRLTIAGDTNNHAIPGDYNNWSGDFRLKPGSPGTGSGDAVLLFNFNDLDSTPILGAQRASEPVMKFGRAAAPADGTGPIAALSVTPSSGQAGVTLFTFSAAASSAGDAALSTLRLQFGDGTEVTWTDKGQAQTHTYTAASATPYTATLTVTDTGGRQASDSKAVAVGSGPTGPDAVLSVTPSSGQAGVTVFNFSAAGSSAGSAGPIATLRLAFGDGSPDVVWADKSQAQTHTYTAAGSYMAVLTATDTTGRAASTGKTIPVGSTSAFPLFISANPGLVINRIGQQIAFTVTTPDTTAVIKQVDFAVDGVVLATDTASPFVFSWVPAASDQAGAHSMVVTATDAQNRVATEMRTLTLLSDNCSIFASATSALQGETLDFQGLCTAAQTVNRMEFFVDNVLQSGNRDASTPYTWRMDTSWFATGTHTVRARGLTKDAAGNDVLLGEQSANIVITAPALSLSFSPGPVVNRTEDVTITPSAPGRTLRQVDYYFNGVFTSGENVAPFVFTWRGNSRPDRFGRQLLVAQATDTQGNVITARRDLYVLTQTCNLLLATSKYLVSSHDTVLVGPRTMIRGEPLVVQGLCTASQSVSRVDFYVKSATDTSPGPGVQQISDSTAPYGWAIDTSPFAAGAYNVTMIAQDGAGGSFTHSAAIEIVEPAP